MKIDAAFLREVQKRGWLIEAVTEQSCVARCNSQSCSLRVALRPGGHIPAKLREGRPSVALGSFEDARIALKERRHILRLTISQTEHMAGIATDHLAKAEKENPTRLINVDLFILWANSLGYDVVLQQADLPSVTLREIIDTRDVAERRGEYFNRRDAR